jgi:hypothetical protein
MHKSNKENRFMENKSTLGPLFVLSFLIMIVLICILFSISSIMLGSAYSFYQISKEGNIIMPSDKPQIESTQTIQLTPPQILETIPLIEFTILRQFPQKLCYQKLNFYLQKSPPKHHYLLLHSIKRL